MYFVCAKAFAFFCLHLDMFGSFSCDDTHTHTHGANVLHLHHLLFHLLLPFFIVYFQNFNKLQFLHPSPSAIKQFIAILPCLLSWVWWCHFYVLLYTHFMHSILNNSSFCFIVCFALCCDVSGAMSAILTSSIEPVHISLIAMCVFAIRARSHTHT